VYHPELPEPPEPYRYLREESAKSILFFWVALYFGQQTVSEEARRHMARGQAAVEMAKSPVDLDDAVKEFQEAARLAPDWPDPYYNLGLVQEKAGKFREAIANLKECLRLAPNAPDAAKVKEQIYKLEYKTEQVLSVSDIIDVLVSFSNWEKAGGRCIDQPFAFIKRKDNNSVEYSSSFYLGGYGPDMRLAGTKKIECRVFNMIHTVLSHFKWVIQTSPSASFFCHPRAFLSGIWFYIIKAQYKSRHSGLFFSSKAVFHALFHFLSCFSLDIALFISSVISKGTRLWMWYLFVKPSAKSFL
jgi:tetratricopeptide (TPR) repeat protein